MYHHPSRAAKTGRVVARDGINFSLNYSLQAQASPVSERPSSNLKLSDWKQGNDTVSSVRPGSSAEASLGRSGRFSLTKSPLENDKLRGNERSSSVLQYSHSTMDTSQDSRQNFATPSFRELNKIQRQVFQPSVSVANESSTSLAASHSQANQGLVPTDDEGNSYQLRNALSAGSQARVTDKSQVFLPGDRVIFAESPSAPGVPVVYRLPDERQANPDRLNLDRRRLTVCPLLEGEENLRLLNFQHNLITKIQHLSNLRRLIFLDIYDNQIEEIAGLSCLKSLRVLMLGKNRIRRIHNLETLTKLDVLDLHGNRISKIENLNHLSELRVLNLAGNEIQHVSNISGMTALAELNLRRNQICTVEEVNRLENLQRLFLSFNCITSFEDISCLSQSPSIIELSLDGNPFCSESSYKQTILKHVTCIRQLDMKRITEEERRIATVMAKKEEEKKREINKLAILKEKRRIAISNAQRQWEVAQLKSSRQTNPKTLSDISSYQNDANDAIKLIDGDSLSICHLAELDGDTLYLYGPGSLDALDRNWGAQAVNSVLNMSIKFINYDTIVPYFSKISTRFPSLVGLIFTETQINSLRQINALCSLRKLDFLTINNEGNPVTKYTLWKHYTLFRLSHFSLSKINDIEITAEDTVIAEKLFGSLAHLTTSQLPQSRLLSLLGDSRRKNTDEKTKKSEGKHERTSSAESVGRAGLQYWSSDIYTKKKEEADARKAFAHNYMKEIVNETLIIEQKRKRLDKILPTLFNELVEEAFDDVVNMDSQMVQSLEKIKQNK
ncbi:leucine-rich repeat-containing protein 49-like [Actinia tenebrosa]|uniref:Leucine-rich repeat-containing protein 49-like n=1 Tax=Actinia tenebrosa TaxID=6105 RepID=A0A6P8IJK0_ACTTE|nr:leucine-rich repeat-containing protein 49-like [Actinia tenebrosa]